MRVGVGLGPFYVSGRIGGRRRRRYRSRPPHGVPWLIWLVLGALWLEFLVVKWLLWMPAVWLCRSTARWYVARNRQSHVPGHIEGPRSW